MATYTDHNENIRLADIIKILWKKVLWIVLALAIGLAAGAGYGFLKTRNDKQYGSTVEFFVNPTRKGQTGNNIYGVYGATPVAEMIGQLESDYFSEYLFLEEYEGYSMPRQGISDAIDAKIAESLTVIQNAEATEEEKHAAAWAAVEEWQKDPNYVRDIAVISGAITFSRGVKSESSSAVSFICVDIRVDNNEAFANTLLHQIKERVPQYVEKNMLVPTTTDGIKFDGTNCTRMSRTDDIVLLNPGNVTSSIMKNGAIFGVLAAFAACAVVLIAHSFADKKTQAAETEEPANKD